MRAISRRMLREFWQKHPAGEAPLSAWFKVVEKADWSDITEVRGTFPHADAVKVRSGSVMTVFNVGGNNYRVVTRIIYEYRRLYVKRVMTHDEYSKGHWKDQL